MDCKITMARMRASLLVLMLLVGSVMCGLDVNVCDVVKESCGLIPPPLPSDFEIKGEHVDYLQNTAAYHEMYFDNVNLRGKIMYLVNGIEHHFIFDYDNAQIIEYDLLHPGEDITRDPLSHTCVATNMANSPRRFIFGYKDPYFETKHSKMYDANEALRFGGRYKFAYNGTEDISDRGLKVDKFKGCVYDREMDATLDLDFYFTNILVGPSGGTLENDVDDTENGVLLSVMAKVDYKGIVWDDETKKNRPLSRSKNYAWFQGFPVFDYKQFQIPPLMFCKNFRGQKEMPKFPLAFSTRTELTNVTRDIFGKLAVAEVISFREIWYDNDRGLVRRDYKPVAGVDTEIFSVFQSWGPVREVYDFKTGILFITNKASGRCFKRIIRNGDYFETSKNELAIEMGTPEEVFLMDTDQMEYKGRDFSRDIECNVWTGKSESKEYGTIYKETYISTDGWHEEADEKVSYGVPVKHSVVTNAIVDGEFTESIKEMNFLKFRPKAPPLVVYDIGNCIETTPHKHFGIVLNVPKDNEAIIRDYIFLFYETAQSYLASVSQVVSFLRVQKLMLQEVKDRFVLTFVLVGKFDLKNPTFAEKGAILEDAIDFLTNHINNGMFDIKFTNPINKEVLPITVSPGGLIDLTPGKQGKIYSQDVNNVEEQKKMGVKIDSEYRVMFDDATEENVKTIKGMSPGALAGLSIAMLVIGVAIGIALMYLYIRKFSDQEKQIQYAMRQTSQT